MACGGNFAVKKTRDNATERAKGGGCGSEVGGGDLDEGVVGGCCGAVAVAVPGHGPRAAADTWAARSPRPSS